MKFKNWKVPLMAPECNPALLELGRTPLLAAILSLRGMTDPEEARRFLFGGAELMESPTLLDGMTDAVQRISRAIALDEHVAVYGDYDVDGITAGCLLTHYLRSRGLNCELYIPDRLGEGYGLNTAAIDRLKERGVTLIVTVDCGVTNIEECEYAASLGIDMVVTDHHECRRNEEGDEILLPEAEAVVDPKRSGNGTPGQGLAGVGVAFKLVCAMEGDAQSVLERYGDLVAAGTVADVMPLLGENRYVVQQGLRMIANRTGRPGFTALLEEAGAAERKCTSSTIGYTLAPRINAAGRLGETHLAIRLLETDDVREARSMASQLCARNTERQSLEKEIWAEALEMLREHPVDKPIVLASEKWHPGVIGIVASRLTDTYSVPAVMICIDGELGKGSCRSTGSFNLYEALDRCGDCLEGFGGHAMAAGITVKADRINDLRRKLCEFYEAHPDRSVPQLEAEVRIEDPALLTEECVESLDLLEPCGNGNPRPLMYMEGAVLESVTPIGNHKHLRSGINAFGESFDCVFFNQTPEELGCRAGHTVDLVFAPQINEFRGKRNVQLVITDMRPHRACGKRNTLDSECGAGNS